MRGELTGFFPSCRCLVLCVGMVFLLLVRDGLTGYFSMIWRVDDVMVGMVLFFFVFFCENNLICGLLEVFLPCKLVYSPPQCRKLPIQGNFNLDEVSVA